MDPTAVAPKLIPERIIKKIPGKIDPAASRDKDVILDDLSKKDIPVLKELLERQIRILSNKSLVSKLKDKGARVKELKERIEKELQARNEVDNAATLLSQLTIGQLNELEWTGHCNPGHRNKISNDVSEEFEKDETDPLKILATHSGVTAQKKQIKILNPEESLIKPEDLISNDNGEASEDNNSGAVNRNSSITSASTSSHPHDEPELYARFVCQRFGHIEGKERFKPNKPLKPFTGEFPFKPPGRVSSKPTRWEETNVTPPLAVHEDAKVISLEESLELQREHAHKLKEVQAKHAAERLKTLQGISLSGPVSSSVFSSLAYRSRTDSSSESEEEAREAEIEDQEVHDDDQRDTDTAVVYNIVS